MAVQLIFRVILSYLVIGTVGIARAADVDMKVVAFPKEISRYSPFYVRVRITNNGNVPIRGCDDSQDKCIAIGWEFAKFDGVLTMPGNGNMTHFPAFINDFLLSGESTEKSIRIIPVRPPEFEENTILTLSLLLKDGSNVQIAEERLKLKLQDPTRAVKNRRGRVRFLVYTYFFLTVLIIGLVVFRHRGQA